MIPKFVTGKSYDIVIKTFSASDVLDDFNNTLGAYHGVGNYDYILTFSSSSDFIMVDGEKMKVRSITDFHIYYYRDVDVEDSEFNIKIDYVGTDGSSYELIVDGDSTYQFYGYISAITQTYQSTPITTFEDTDLLMKIFNDSNFVMFLNLYKYSKEKDIVDKSSYLSSPLTLYGQLTEECDILNPSILLQYDDISEPLFNFNYLYIPLFNRYYFITDIISVRKGVWRILTHIDVLYTYNTDIRKQSGLIVRNENNPYSVKFVKDDRLTFLSKPTYTITGVTGGTTANFTFQPISTAGDWCNKILVVLNNKATNDQTGTITTPTGTSLSPINTKSTNNPTAYIYTTNSANWSLTSRTIANQQTLASYIMNAYALPIDCLMFSATAPLGIFEDMVIGTSTLTGCQGVPSIYDMTPYLILADFTLPSITTFLDYEPYVTCQLYIPYYNGFYEFNLKRCGGHNILVYYTIQLSSGQANVYVYDETEGMILMTSPVQLSMPLAVSTTNAYEINVQRTQVGIELINRSLDNVAKGVMSAISYNYIGLTKEMQSLFGNLVNTYYEDMLMQDVGNVGITSANAGYYNPQNVYLITIKQQIQNGYTTEFLHRNGYPINKWDKLEVDVSHKYTGYTEITQMHYTPSTQTYITSSEIDEIEELAKTGIIL